MKTFGTTTVALAIALLLPLAAAATDLISVDLESSYPGQGAPFSGVDPAAATADPVFNAANVWNVLGSTGFNVPNPSFPNLVDSAGGPAGVDFNIVGNISAQGAGNPADALVTDYFYWNTPLASSTYLDWELRVWMRHRPTCFLRTVRIMGPPAASTCSWTPTVTAIWETRFPL